MTVFANFVTWPNLWSKSAMAAVVKCMLGLFILAGVTIAAYACRELLGTAVFVKENTGRVHGVFLGYVREEVVSRSSSPSPANWGEQSFTDTASYMSYPEFEFDGQNGQKVRVVGGKQHIIERFIPGQQVKVIVSPYGDRRLADFYSLYSLDLCILAFGLCFIFIPALIWSVVVPGLATPAGREMTQRMGDTFAQFVEMPVGPFRVITILKGTAVLVAFMVVLALASGLTTYVKQLRLWPGYALIEKLEKKRFDEARDLIARKKGINTVNEYGQSPLLLALEAGRFDLAQQLIEAGADVNVKSKMYMTPLRSAAAAGDIETVRLLLARGASPDTPEDEVPPFVSALTNGHDDVARLIIESGCDLHRRYALGEGLYTVGDMTVMAKRPALTDLVRRRGGSFKDGR